MASRVRQNAERRGRFAENICMLLLRAKGYRILQHRFRCSAGEVDIIARRGQVIAFIEVKARQRLDRAAESIGPAQRARIMRTAEHYLARNQPAGEYSVRFDAMLVIPRRFPVHICEAWRE